MNKKIIEVPPRIDYLSDWKEFTLPDHPCILNKQITGCGFTQWCLTNNQNIILCSPRRILLENKEDQYLEELSNIKKSGGDLPYKIFYARNEYEKIIECDLDTNKDDLRSDSNSYKEEEARRVEKAKIHSVSYKNSIKNFVNSCLLGPFNSEKICKILVTYDSYRKVKEALEELGVLDQFHVVVDEFQSIFTDSTFKANTEMEFVDHLQGLQKICYVSATPMLEEYMDMLEEFKDLPYYEMDWGVLDPGRLFKPNIQSYPCSKLMRKAYEIVEKYKTDQWRDSDGNTKSFIGEDGMVHEIQSKEVVIFMNSVKNICDIIRYCKLIPDQCNILCANTQANKDRIKKAFGLKKSDFYEIGKVPKKSEMHLNKMFTFCTRTVYLGADFYSTNARTYVFSDANSKCLTIDISLDLPQIVGRQRYDGNPWKNEVNFYFFSTRKDKNQSKEEFINEINLKKEKSQQLLNAFNATNIKDRPALVENYETVAITKKYENNYIAVNKHKGSAPIPVFNNLVLVSELRSYFVGQIDYADQFSVRYSLRKQFGIEESKTITNLVNQFNEESGFIDKMKFLCSLSESDEVIKEVLEIIGDYYSNYYRILGPDRIKSLSYRRDYLEKELKSIINNQFIDPSEEIYNNFQEGERYSNKFIKTTLSIIYDSLEYKKTPKATDLEEWFEIKKVNYMNNGKKVNGIEIIKKK